MKESEYLEIVKKFQRLVYDDRLDLMGYFRYRTDARHEFIDFDIPTNLFSTRSSKPIMDLEKINTVEEFCIKNLERIRDDISEVIDKLKEDF